MPRGRGHAREQASLGFDVEADPFAPEEENGARAVLSAPAPAAAAPGGEAEPGDPAPAVEPDEDAEPQEPDAEPEQPEGEAAEEFRIAFGMSLSELMAPERLVRGDDPAALFAAAERHAARVVAIEESRRESHRRMLRDLLRQAKDPPPHAGLHRASAADLERVARGILYNGRAEAVAGGAVFHRTLPLTLGQIVVCAVAYDGTQDQWHQRVARQELALNLADPEAEAEAVLDLRDRVAPGGRLDALSDMARRGFVAYRERQVMLRECGDRWRLGFGMPAPLDLLTGMGHMEFLELSLDLMRSLLTEDPRWLFVSSGAAEPGLETLAGCLCELEFAVVMRLHTRLKEMVDAAHCSRGRRRLMDRFVEEVGRSLVLGFYRAGPLSPPRFFVAHEQHVYTAALIALADSLAAQPAGFPALVELARAGCRALLGGGQFERMVEQAYRQAGAPEWFHRGEIS